MPFGSNAQNWIEDHRDKLILLGGVLGGLKGGALGARFGPWGR